MESPGFKAAVITVHGTGDSADTADGEKWWQRGSSFCARLKSKLAEAKIDAEITPFIWSGANNVLERERAALKLAAMLRRCAKRNAGVHVIGHSHGGNVANDAAIYLRWGQQRKKEHITSLVTVGTPFLKSPVTDFQRWGAYAFLAIGIVGALILGAVSIGSLVNAAMQDGSYFNMTIVSAILVLGGIAFFFMLREGVQGLRRVSRPGLNSRPVSILSIWHPADEAISILRATGALEIEPFARGSIFLGSRTGAILWAVRLVIAFVVVAIAFLIASYAGADGAVEVALIAAGLGELGAWLNSPDGLGLRRDEPLSYLIVLLTILGAAALLWLAVYVAFRAVFGWGLEVFGRGWMNRSVREIFRGMAFGSVGDQRPTAVDVASYVIPTQHVELTGELAERLKTSAADGATRLLDKYRWEIFNVRANHAELFGRVPRDAMTWDSLIHTTYFDHAEIADMIAKHVVEREQARASDVSAAAGKH